MIKLVPHISSKQLAWRNHPDVMKWTSQNSPISETEMDQWFDRLQQDSSQKIFGIETLKSPTLVGTCGFKNMSLMHGSAEFSLLIGPEFHRKGYGRAALIELLRHGFQQLRLNCIYGECLDGNPALELFKQFFQFDGLLRQKYFKEGGFKNTHIMSLLKKEAKVQEWY